MSQQVQEEEEVYMDYAGAGIASREQLDEVHKLMIEGPLLANPHSGHSAGKASNAMMEEARRRTLNFFGAAEEYGLIFTAGCTSSLRLIATSFPVKSGGKNKEEGKPGGKEETIDEEEDQPQSQVWIHSSAHNSAVGVREVLVQKGALFREFTDPAEAQPSPSPPSGVPHLAVFPAECNATGQRFDIAEMTSNIRGSFDNSAVVDEEGVDSWGDGGTGSRRVRMVESSVCVVVDGAAAAGRMPIALDGTGVDFFAFSYYKMFGHPTGIGALIYRKRTAERFLTDKVYFGGGTVEYVVPEEAGAQKFRASLSARFEDGTPNYGAIAALSAGFNALTRVGGVEGINMKVQRLRKLFKSLALRRLVFEGQERCLVKFYHEDGDMDEENNIGSRHSGREGSPDSILSASTAPTTNHHGTTSFGGTIVFSLQDDQGRPIGHALVDQLANAAGFMLRTGCFCNPGICRDLIGLNKEKVLKNAAAGHVCWDDRDVVDGEPTGLVRISFGAYSEEAHVHRFIEFLEETFLTKSVIPTSNSVTTTGTGRSGVTMCQEELQEREHGERRVLRSMVVFPVKGVSGVSLNRWYATSEGLLYDRHWMLVSAATGSPVVPKTNIKIASNLSVVDFNLRYLELSSGSCTKTLKLGCGAKRAREPEVEEAEGASTRGVWYPAVAKTVEGGENSVSIRGSVRKGFDYYGKEVDEWLSVALGEEVRLLRRRKETSDGSGGANFRNTGEFLVVDYDSYQVLLNNVPEEKRAGIDLVDAFRPNLVTQSLSSAVSSSSKASDKNAATNTATKVAPALQLFAEQNWKKLKFLSRPSEEENKSRGSSQRNKGEGRVLVYTLEHDAPCYRCMQVGVKANQAKITSEPLATVSRLCRSVNQSEKPVFGAIFSPSATIPSPGTTALPLAAISPQRLDDPQNSSSLDGSPQVEEREGKLSFPRRSWRILLLRKLVQILTLLMDVARRFNPMYLARAAKHLIEWFAGSRSARSSVKDMHIGRSRTLMEEQPRALRIQNSCHPAVLEEEDMKDAVQLYVGMHVVAEKS